MREAISYEFEDFRLDVKRQALHRNGEPVTLTHKAYQVLLVLVQNSEQTVEKEYIYQQLWGDSFVEEANLTQHVYVLRKTLGKTSIGESFIETVARTGYRFVPKVRPVFPSAINETFYRPRGGAEPALKAEPNPFAESHLRLAENMPVVEPETESVDAEQPLIVTPEEIKRSNRDRWLMSIALVALAAIIIAAVFYFRSTPVNAPVRSVAVLPFSPIGEASQRDKLGLGMADSIITRLSKLQQVPVRPTSSIVAYTDAPPANSIEAGRQMGVDTVVEGTVQHDGERVRVAVKLIEVATGKSLWAENFDESYTNIFSVQDSISQKVVRALAINLSKQQEKLLSQDSTTSVAALQAYQIGYYLYSTRSKEGLSRSVEYMEEAIRHDPNFAKAYAIEADAYNMLRYYGYADVAESRDKAQILVNKALELNQEIPEAYIALANLQMMKRDSSAKASLERAIALSPYNGTARLRYAWVIANDDVAAASEQMRLAQEYDPLSGVANGAYCNLLILESRFDDAIKFCERSVMLTPETPSNRILLADAYSLSGRHTDALAEIERRINETSGVERLMATGSKADYLIRAGRVKEGEAIYLQLKAEAQRYPELLADLAVIAYALNRQDEGFVFLEKGLREGRVQVVMLNHNPIWAKVNADHRVSELFSRLRKEREAENYNR